MNNDRIEVVLIRDNKMYQLILSDDVLKAVETVLYNMHNNTLQVHEDPICEIKYVDFKEV